MLFNWLRSLRRMLGLSESRGSRGRRARLTRPGRPQLEWLEGRVTPSTLTIAAARDNSIFSESPNNSDGASYDLFTGRTNQSGGAYRRSLIDFDLSAIPNGAVIDSVSLTMVMSGGSPSGLGAGGDHPQGYTGPIDISLDRMLANWGAGSSGAGLGNGGSVAPGTGGPPGGSGGAAHGFAATTGDATWTYNFFNTTTWTTPGGDFVTTPSATQSASINPQYVTWSSAGLVSDVQGWVNKPTTNFGWAIIGDESTIGTSRLFVSSESPHVAYRPALTVVYDVPTISTQPANATIDNGQSDTLSVTAASGTPDYTYQWYTGVSGVTTSPIGGATSSSYVAAPTSTTSYWVMVTDSAGASIDSSTATVTVNPAIILTSSTQTVVASSFFDSGVYEFEGGTGALLKTLVAPNSQSTLSGPSGITVGPDGNLYFASEFNSSVVEYSFSTQSLSTFISASQLAAPGVASDPSGLAFGPDGNLYVSLNGGEQAFSGGAVVRFNISSSGGQLAYTGTFVDIDNNFVQPTEMTFGANAGDTGNLYVSDAGTDSVVKITDAVGASPSSSTFISAGSGGLNYPSGSTWSGGKLYVVDLGATSPFQGQVLEYNADGSFDTVFTQTSGALQFQFPSDALFLANGDLLTADLGPTYPVGTPGVPASIAIGTSGSIGEFAPNGTFGEDFSASAFPASSTTGVTNFSPSQLALDATAPGSGSSVVLAPDTVGVAYNQTITVGGGTGTVSLSVSNIDGAIAGPNIPSTGTGSLNITGTPTDAGTETFTVTATDAIGSTTSITYSITANPAIALSTTTLPPDTINVGYNQTITASGGTGAVALNVNVSNAVPGLNITGNGAGAISITGMPTAAGTETFTVIGTDAAGASTGPVSYSNTVSPAIALSPTNLPADTLNVAYNQTITASGGTGAISLTANVTNAIAGLNVQTSGIGSIAISGTPTVAATETFTVTGTDAAGASTEPVSYSITVNPAIALSPTTLPPDTVNVGYHQTITGSGGTGAVALNVNVTNAVPGLNITGNGTGVISITGMPTADGIEAFTVAGTDAAGASTGPVSYFIAVNPAITLSTTTLPPDTINVGYNQTITASGGTGAVALTANVTNPIDGLTISGNGTGNLTISGTPTASGTEMFTVTGTDATGASTGPISYSISVNQAIVVSVGTVSIDTVNVPYNQTISVSGGTGDVSLTAKITDPIAGLVVTGIGTSSLTISGTPTASGTETVTVTGTDTTGATVGPVSYSITVPPTLSISGASSVNEGATYTLNLSGTDGSPNTISGWTINWDDGSALQNVGGNPTSVIHVYAVAPNSYTISATATDNVGTYAAANTVAVTVNHVSPTLTISGAASVNEGATYKLTLSGSDKHAITNWTINWGDGSALQTVSGSPSSVTHVYAVGPNSYATSATATDNVGTFAASDTVAVTVNHVPPTLKISGAASVNEGATYKLTLSGSDTHTIKNWTINWGDGSTLQTVSGNPLSVTHVYAVGPNSYKINATATDNVGTFAASNTVAVSVNHVPPTLKISGPASVKEGASYKLTLSGSDTHTIKNWTINWGDGSALQTVSGNPSSVTHVYTFGPKSYKITAAATDNAGTYKVNNGVTVTVAHVPPKLVLSGPATVTGGASYVLNLSGIETGKHTIKSWTINWGDGTIQTVTGNPTSVTHTFANVSNTLAISATARDDVGDFQAMDMVVVTVFRTMLAGASRLG
jgi:hypothetical protein